MTNSEWTIDVSDLNYNFTLFPRGSSPKEGSVSLINRIVIDGNYVSVRSIDLQTGIITCWDFDTLKSFMPDETAALKRLLAKEKRARKKVKKEMLEGAKVADEMEEALFRLIPPGKHSDAEDLLDVYKQAIAEIEVYAQRLRI
jgi:hypothetical protein